MSGTVCCYAPDGNSFATTSDDQTVKIWSDKQKPLVLQHHAPVKSVSYSPDGKLVVTATARGVLSVWEVIEPKLLTEICLDEENAKRCVWTAGNLVIATFESGTVYVVQPETGDVKARFISGKSLLASAISPEGLRILITTKPGPVFLLAIQNLVR